MIFKALEQPLHGLLAHARAISERARANSIRTRELQHPHVRQAQAVKARRIQLPDDAALDGLGWNAQQRADEHLATTYADPDHSVSEQREITVGRPLEGHLIFVAHCERDGKIRIISARLATARERKQYEEEIRRG
ncbi:MAG: BrnT family toxin [Bryobacteraceae bacterium]|nr:BrnT family toxin [Bryobacteraceae bacterium]